MEQKCCKFIIVLGLLYGLFMFLGTNLMAQENKVKIVKRDAVVRLKPDENSLVIKRVPLGGLLDFEGLMEGWAKVKLPPDDSGIVVIGYIHSSFIEMEKHKIVGNTNQITEEPNLEQEGYYEWKRELVRAKSKKASGTPLLIIGTVITVIPLYYIIRGPGPQYYNYYYTWSKILFGAGILGGTICIIFGISNASKGRRMIKQLEEEGRARGYLSIGLLPKYEAVGIQVKVSF